jgi:hypothetical protein
MSVVSLLGSPERRHSAGERYAVRPSDRPDSPRATRRRRQDVNGLSAGVEFGPPQRARDATSREARGRRCEAPGCSTVLSTYNRSRTCYLHTKPEYRHALQR